MTGRLRHEAGLALYAMQFLTRIPAPGWVGHDAERLDRSVRYFPLVGAVVGLLSGLVWLGLATVMPALPAAAIAVMAGVLLTGAFHEDGLADTWDGIGGGLTRESALEIMRDSRLGSYGGAALVFSLLVRTALLATLDPLAGLIALVSAHAAGRTIVCAAIRFARYARSDGLAKPVAGRLRPGEWPFALGLGLVFAAASGWPGLAGLALAAVAGQLMLRVLKKKLGGYTGDGLGALEQTGEIAALGMIVAWLA